MNEDAGNLLAASFVALLADRAMRSGQVASSWEALQPTWKRIFADAVLAFLEERGCGLILLEKGKHRMSTSLQDAASPAELKH